MDLILYHRSCPDGFCAAYIAKKRYPEAQLVALDHGQPEDVITALISTCAGLDVLMVDFSFRTRELNERMAATAKSFRILDHHKTAQAVLEGLAFATFDMNRSGAGLTWDTLFGAYDHAVYTSGVGIRLGPGREYIGLPEPNRPWYVDYVEDRDLWNHKLPKTKEINAFIMTLPFSLEAWRNLESMSMDQAVTSGAGALAHVEHYVREAVAQRQIGKLNDLSVAVVNALYLNCSEVGNVLTDFAEIGMTWFERGDGLVQFSLRSKDEVDVSAIATPFGGGGHK